MKEVKNTPTKGDFHSICKQCGEEVSGMMFEESF